MALSRAETSAWVPTGRHHARCANLGIRFLLAESINGLFFRNSVNFGFIALECSGCFAAFDESDTAELDLVAWRVRNSRTGVMLTPARIPERLLALMQGGGIFPLMEKEGLIAPQSWTL